MKQLTQAAQRLENVIDQLETALDGLFANQHSINSAQTEMNVLRQDRVKLAEELDAAKARERELEELANEASLALGEAIAQMQITLDKT